MPHPRVGSIIAIKECLYAAGLYQLMGAALGGSMNVSKALTTGGPHGTRFQAFAS
ncbi:MAG: hypothetical protein K0Q60_3994 [Microvirga sp.]|jgi:hypothetical protein|nr:hypothetical protein [Microvirga sp.]